MVKRVPKNKNTKKNKKKTQPTNNRPKWPFWKIPAKKKKRNS